MSAPLAGYSDLTGTVKFNQLGSALAGPAPDLNKLSFMVAGDAMSARGVWETKSGERVSGYLAVDFKQTSPWPWRSAWRIWRITVFPADQPPTPMGAYCHYDEATAWSLNGAAGGR